MAVRTSQLPYLFPEGAHFGTDNVILHAKARRHRVSDFGGPVSIKTVVKGAVTWTVGGHDLVVDPASFLLLGDGEKYSMDVDAPCTVETACAFFVSGSSRRPHTTPPLLLRHLSMTRIDQHLTCPIYPAFMSIPNASFSARSKRWRSAALPSSSPAALKKTFSCCPRACCCSMTK